eukprot:CAMPEP_0184008914 /NCGR_PEP_ID=MMETSP0954-20121128/2274_1 /TAXON_ID=627963 /ORGANISM="Aplanochytrium sp, Strain PBS07" /LENGTH=459 /DNA_ID=CAMNT_0026288149 /DNA_START=247 /DNA_END=1626 /DNA_ORIENTATION=-
MMGSMETLKRACERCTKSKVKCEYGREQEPCKRCLRKGYVCVYRPKRKRGPQKDKDKKKGKGPGSFDTACFSRVSSLERRIWSVFFTIFKHQNLMGSKYAWCWFAQQLNKLDKYLQQTDNEDSRKMLKSWMEALNLDVHSIVSEYSSTCSFSSSMCGGCSAEAIGPPIDRPIEPAQLHSVSQYSKERLSDDNSKPVLRSYNTDKGSVVYVNAEFEKVFGLSSKDLQEILEWSGGGFLPWGGDLLAKIVSKVSNDTVRQIPSTHIFDLWCVDEDGEVKCYQPYLLNSFHQETIRDHKEMTTEMRIEFQSVGPRVNATFGDHPVSLDNPLQEAQKNMKALKKRKSSKESTDVISLLAKPKDVPTSPSQKNGQSPVVKSEPACEIPSLPSIDRIPSSLEAIYDWSDDIAYVQGQYPGDEYFRSGPPVSDENTDMQFLSGLMPEDSTFNIVLPGREPSGSPLQ